MFVSLLRNGVFQPPQRIDTGLTAASSQPVVATVNGGVTQIAFVNAGTLYTVGSANLLQPLSAPAALATAATNPAHLDLDGRQGLPGVHADRPGRP